MHFGLAVQITNLTQGLVISDSGSCTANFPNVLHVVWIGGPLSHFGSRCLLQVKLKFVRKCVIPGGGYSLKEGVPLLGRQNRETLTLTGTKTKKPYTFWHRNCQKYTLSVLAYVCMPPSQPPRDVIYSRVGPNPTT